MDLKVVIIISVIVVLILIFTFVPEVRTMLKGFTRLFVKDMAQTPEGAAAIYEEKINEMSNKYSDADNALRIAAGRLSTEKKKLDSLQNKLKAVEAECESLVKAGRIDLAQVKAEEREEVLSDIERSQKLVKAYTVAKNDAEEVHKSCEANLRKLKRESKETVENMKVKAQLNEVYDSMDELKNVTTTDKLLDSIREKNNDLNSSVDGARAVHNARTSTKVQKADEQAKKLASDDYLNSLQKKYNK